MRRLLGFLREHRFSPTAWGLLLALATVVYYAASRLVQNLAYRGYQRPPTLFASFGADFWRPEPLEVPLYVAGYLVIPALALVGYAAYRRGWLRRLSVPLLLAAALAVVAAGAWLLGWLPRGLSTAASYAAEHGVAKGVWLLVTKRLFAMRLLFALVGVFLLAQLYARRPRALPLLAADRWGGWRWLQPLFLLVVVVFLFHPNFPFEPHHYAYFLGPANDLLHGRALLYETSHLYGLLDEYALAGLFALGLPLTYASLSAVLFVAFAGFILGWYALLRRWLGSPALATFGVLATMAWLFLFQTSPTRSVYYFPAMTPYRFWLFLPVVWMLISQAVHPRRWRRYAIIAGSSLAVFWNLENGIFTAVAAWLCLTYVELKPQSSNLKAESWAWFKPLAGLALAWIVTIAAIAAIITGVNWAIVGYPPDWGAYLREVLPFGTGIGMTPLPSVGLFELFVVAYAATFAHTLRRMLRREPLDVGALFFALFGAASLLYYIGESTWQNLYLVTAPLIGLLLWVIRAVLQHPPADYTLARLATAGVNAAVVLVAGMLLLKVPVELGTRNYPAAAASFYRPLITNAALAADAAVLRQDFGELPRLAVFSHSDVPLLLTLGKANALDLYYLFNLYYAEQVDALLAQIKRDQPPVLVVGKVGPVPVAGLDLDDQVRYFRDHLPSGYRITRSLQTLDIYERARAAPVP